jgi:fatty acid desaturase
MNLPIPYEGSVMNQIELAPFPAPKPAPLLPHADLAEDVRRLSQVSEWKGIAAVARQWLYIVLTIVGVRLLEPFIGAAWAGFYAVAVVLVASRQHCLLSIMHEATHYRLSRHRKWNDFVSDMFCAFPMGVSTELYRRDHLLHHQYTSTDRDPNWVGMQSHEDWHWPKDYVNAWRLFICDLVGLAAHKTLLFLFMWSPLQATINKTLVLSTSERLRLITFLATTVTVVSLFHLWFVVFAFWVVPAVTVLGFLLRLRSLAEHSVVEGSHEFNVTRHVDASWWERLTLAPLNVNYHLAHHLYPSVPFYNLPALHARLLRCAAFRENAHITHGYLGDGVLREITAEKVS